MSFLWLSLCVLLPEAEPLVWQDRTRDIYVDGALSREAGVYAVGEFDGLALRLPGAGGVLLLQEVDGRIPVSRAEGVSFILGKDRLSLESGRLGQLTLVGEALEVAEHAYQFAYDGHVYLITSHQGPAGGPIDTETLWRTVPAWQRLAEAYRPDPGTMAALRAVDAPFQLEVFMGTWCGDSRREVPRLLRVLEGLDKDLYSLDLVAVSRRFRQPAEQLRARAITNVPTIIVSRGGLELGRLVEHASGADMESDLVAILNGSYQFDPGFLKEGSLVDQGTWVDQGSNKPVESWRVYQREARGTRLYCRQEEGDLVRDIWCAIDQDGVPGFLEITETRGSRGHRIRYFIGDELIRVTLRGPTTGVLEQEPPRRGSLWLNTPSAYINTWLAGRLRAKPEQTLVAGARGGNLERVMAFGHRELGGLLTVTVDDARFCLQDGKPINCRTPAGEVGSDSRP